MPPDVPAALQALAAHSLLPMRVAAAPGGGGPILCSCHREGNLRATLARALDERPIHQSPIDARARKCYEGLHWGIAASAPETSRRVSSVGASSQGARSKGTMITRCFEGTQFMTGWLLLIVGCITLIVVERLRVRQWDHAWREGWERRHGRSLDTLRNRRARFLRVFRVSWGIVGVLIVGSEILIGLEVFAPAIRGVTLPEMQILELCRRAEAVILLLAIFLVGGALAIRNLRSGIRRIDELLARPT